MYECYTKYLIIIIIKKGRQCKAGGVVYTLSVQRPQPHNTNVTIEIREKKIVEDKKR